MDQQPNQTKGGNTALWIVFAVVVIAAAGIAYYMLRNTGTRTNTNSNANVNTEINTNVVANTSVDSDSWNVVSYSGVPIEIHYPKSSSVEVQSLSTSTIDEEYINFTIVLTDSNIPGQMVFSNRDTGFEEEKITSETEDTIDSLPARVLLTEETDTSEQTTKTKRWLFYPLNPNTNFETLWISYPSNSDEQTSFFDDIISKLKIVQ